MRKTPLAMSIAVLMGAVRSPQALPPSIPAAPIPSGKVVRVRFRGASTSDDILAFSDGVKGDGNG